MNTDKRIYVIGHKNPDTDSICSAIAYANLKRTLSGEDFVAKRAGQLNEETQYVLKRFGVPVPALLRTVKTQVKDVEINRNEGIKSNMSIKDAWEMMKENRVMTLSITRDSRLEGVISIGDITSSYMDVYDNYILGVAKTQYRNIVKTIEGEIITGNEHSYFVNGKVVIAASSPETMESFIEEDDLVILGNRYETQLCALELGVRCIVVCEGAEIGKTIIKMAEERSVVIIRTPHDTFTVGRLINQSIPVKHFMCRENLVTFGTHEYLEDVKEVMAKKRYRDFPVIDKMGKYVGLISRRRLMGINRKNVILVDHNEKSQAVDGIGEANVIEIIDHHRLGSMETVSPVYFRNEPVGCTATIVSKMYEEAGIEIPKKIASILCSAILSDTLMFRSPTCTPVDQEIAEKLAEIAEIKVEDLANGMFHAGSNLKDKSPKEICFQDFKKFDSGDVRFGVGQINLMTKGEIKEIKDQVEGYLKTAKEDQELDMVFFMLTNIFKEYSELICYGEGAQDALIEAFDLPEDTEKVVLKGVVSRKKQLIPSLVVTLQQS